MKSNKQPLISVIVPIYKVEEYLTDCIESIIAQSYKNLEIILVDDGSPDGCPGICDSYSKKDKRISVIHKKNGGLSDARNAGIDVATGEYVCFIDSDDYVSSDYISALYDAIEESGADMSVCGYKLVLSGGREKAGEVISDGILSEDEYWQKVYSEMFLAFVVAWNKLYKANIFKSIRYKKGKINEDEIILHDVLKQCKKIAVINKPLYYYRKREESITGKKKGAIIGDDAYEGLLQRATYFLKSKKYRFCISQIHALLEGTTSRKQAKKYSKVILDIAAKVPGEYKTLGIRAKLLALRFMPCMYALKKRN